MTPVNEAGARARGAVQRTADRRELLAVLDELTTSGRRVPCFEGSRADRARWTSDEPDDQEAAATRCLPCPGIASCRAYADTWPREAGVYAGLTEADRRPAHGRPRKTTSTATTTKGTAA